MIIEDYVSFEIAKLLKEKGFDEKCRYVYLYNEALVYAPHFMEGELVVDNSDIESVAKYNDWITYTQGNYAFLCPTLQMAMKWLREVHYLFIQITIIPYTTVTVEQNYYMFAVCKDRRNLVFRSDHPHDKYSTYEEACEEAIKYVLEKLI